VLEVLLGFVDFASGRCDPALDTICAKARLARATVVRAIEALKEHGFLDKVRRTRRTGRGPTEGPSASRSATPMPSRPGWSPPCNSGSPNWLAVASGPRRSRPQEGAGRRAASPPRPSLGTLGSALHPGDKQMARVLDAIGARLDEASSSSPSASSVSGSTPPENLKGKGSLRDTLSDGRSRPNRHPESSTDAPDGTVERIGLRRSGARQGPRRKSRARSGSAAFSDMLRGAWKRVAPHITM
jgi:hypothetical protein